jgi:translocation and assembly module TamA
VTLLSSVTALAAAPLIVAPDELRELLSQHLSMTGNEPQDDTARASLERRWRKEASELLATEGYFSPHVELGNSEADWVLQVEPGKRTQIGSVSIEIRGAITDQRRQQLIASWGLPGATPFRQAAWDDAKQGILRELMTVDFAAARLISSQAEVNVETAQVDLKLVYDAGPRYRYGEIRIVGLQRYPQSLVERYNKSLHPGEAYHQEELLALQSALQNTPYFSSVNVELERLPEGAEESEDVLQVPVIIRLRERAPFNIALGAGVSSNTGARVEGNFRSADFLHRAWELNSGARIEQLRQSVYADVFLPPSAQHRDSIGSVIEKSEIQGLGIERVAFAASRVQSRGSIEQRLGVNWQHERQTPDHAASTVNRALATTGGWVWRHADDPRDASEGIVAQLQLAGAAKSLLSDQNFLRSYFRYSQGIQLGKSDALLVRGEIGVTAAPSRQGIPQDYLFRAGGSNSVRGYSYQSLGVKEGAATLGGRYLLSLSAEYTHWLDARWGVATFVDAGQAADNRDVLKLAQGYGVGARWKSPAGPLAIDLAWGQLDKKLHLHFSLAVPF